jgi:hypothetical protein
MRLESIRQLLGFDLRQGIVVFSAKLELWNRVVEINFEQTYYNGFKMKINSIQGMPALLGEYEKPCIEINHIHIINKYYEFKYSLTNYFCFYNVSRIQTYWVRFRLPRCQGAAPASFAGFIRIPAQDLRPGTVSGG